MPARLACMANHIHQGDAASARPSILWRSSVLIQCTQRICLVGSSLSIKHCENLHNHNKTIHISTQPHFDQYTNSLFNKPCNGIIPRFNSPLCFI